jgi:predicted nucleic acid-binding protein
LIAYVDSSVALRLLLGQPGSLAEWPRIRRAISSSITRVECLRTLENYRAGVEIPEGEWVALRSTTLRMLDSFERIDLDPVVLERAAAPMPTRVRTLDAIHLASAQLWQESQGEPLVLATHDRALANAARAFGMEVIGLS